MPLYYVIIPQKETKVTVLCLSFYNIHLNAARAGMDLPQGDLAERCGVSGQTIRAIEKGDSNPMINLCVVFKIDKCAPARRTAPKRSSRR